MEVKRTIKLRVKVAFGFYSVGHVFFSPPMPGTRRDELLRQGYLEVMTDTPGEVKKPVKRRMRGLSR